MASLIVNQGLQRIGSNASAVGVTPGTNLNTARWLQTMSVDDATESFLAADTKLDDGTGFTQEFDAALDAATTILAQTVSHVMTIPTGSGNFVIRRIALHDNVPASVSSTSTTLVGGVDQQALTKTSSFTLAITLKITYTSV